MVANKNIASTPESRIGLNQLKDRRDLTFNLFEALRILAFQQRRGKDFAAVLGGGAVLHQGLASEVKFLQFKQASLRAGAF